MLRAATMRAATRAWETCMHWPFRVRPRPLLFLAALVVFALTNYGGIRAPDNEVTFRTCESLAKRGTVAIVSAPGWRNFGTAKGVDGKQYSVFGLGQAIACVPFVWAVQATNYAA